MDYSLNKIYKPWINQTNLDAFFAASSFDKIPTTPSEPTVASANERIRSKSADVIGVADGVGGWRAYGVDPGLFSMNLMKSCERLVKAGYFVNDQPAQLLESGFLEMQQSKRPIIGK